MKKANNDNLTTQFEDIEMHCKQCVLAGSFSLQELEEDNTDNDFFNFEN